MTIAQTHVKKSKLTLLTKKIMKNSNLFCPPQHKILVIYVSLDAKLTLMTIELIAH